MTTRMPQLLFQDIGEYSIQYLEYPGEGPTAVFLHATGFSPWLWHPIANRLPGNWRIICPYFCDHRETDPQKGGLSWMLLAEDLSMLLTKIGVSDPYLAGHSMGGTIMVLTNAILGNTARKMMLIEPIFLPGEFYNIPFKVEDHPLAAKSIRRRNHWENRENILSDFKSKPFFTSWDDEMLDMYITHGMTDSEGGGLELACSPQREASLFMGSNHYDPWPILAQTSCPTLILEGGKSENRLVIDLQAVLQKLPRGEYRLLEDVGHLIPMEQPDLTRSIIQDFFSPDQ